MSTINLHHDLNQVLVEKESSSLPSVVERQIKPLPKNRRAARDTTDVGRPGERPHVQKKHFTVPVSPNPPLIMHPDEAELASEDDVRQTVAIAQSLVDETAALRERVDKMKRATQLLKEQAKNMNIAIQMQRVKRERIRTWIDTYQPTESVMPYETLWGKKNGKLIIKARHGAKHTAELEASPSELPDGVDENDLPELGSSSETESQPDSSGSGQQRRWRGNEEDEEQSREKQKRKRARLTLAGGLFEL